MELRKLREDIHEFESKKQTGRITLHFHVGALTCYEYSHTEKVARWGDCAIDHGGMVTEEENIHG